MPGSARCRGSWARRFAAGAHWGTWLGALLLAAGETLRPGFLGLADGAGWVASLSALALAGAAGGALGLVRALPRPLAGIRPGGWLLALWLPLLLVPLVATLISTPRGGSGRSGRIVMLGLDGASWEVIDRFIEAGELPHLARLRRHGATGALRSEEPTLSPQVWTTIATGVGPEQHGITDFFSTQDQLNEPRLWEIVAARGDAVGVWEWLVTWPPDELDGFVVPGWLLRGPETWPPDLATYQHLRHGPGGLGPVELAAVAWWGYRNGLRLPTLAAASAAAVRLKLMTPDEREVSPLQTLVHGEMAIDLFLHHWRRVAPRFGALVLYATDSLGHTHWTDHGGRSLGAGGPGGTESPSRVVLDAYRQGDHALGRLMRVADERTLIMLVSDHGMRGMSQEQPLYAVRTERLIDALDMRGRLSAFTVGKLVQLRATSPGEPASGAPDWVRALEQVELGGEPLFSIRPTGPHDYVLEIRGEPDLERTVTVGDRPVALRELLASSQFSGEHTLDGVIGLWGAGIEPGATVRQATLRDVAPTALTTLGLPLSRKMTGRVLREAFTSAHSRRLEVRRVESYGLAREPREPPLSAEDREDIERRLRALGYVQ